MNFTLLLFFCILVLYDILSTFVFPTCEQNIFMKRLTLFNRKYLFFILGGGVFLFLFFHFSLSPKLGNLTFSFLLSEGMFAFTTLSLILLLLGAFFYALSIWDYQKYQRDHYRNALQLLDYKIEEEKNSRQLWSGTRELQVFRLESEDQRPHLVLYREDEAEEYSFFPQNKDYLITKKISTQPYANSVSCDIILGREECEVVAWHQEVSRRHAMIVYEKEGWFLQDLESRNATFLNEHKLLPRQKLPLQDRDTIRLGSQAAFRVGLSSLVKSIYLKSPDQKNLPLFLPGQYITLKIKEGEGEGSRCYSLSESPYLDFSQNNSTFPSYYRITVKKLAQKGWGSGYLHKIKVGDVLQAEVPAGNMLNLDIEKDEPVVLIAGGIGITPLLSMLNSIAQKCPGRMCWLFYSVKENEAIMEKHLYELGEYPDIHIFVHYTSLQKTVSDSSPKAHIDISFIEDKISQTLILGEESKEKEEKFRQIKKYGDFYLCGPEVMTEEFQLNLQAWGAQNIHQECFYRRYDDSSSQTSRATVTFPTLKESYEWAPQDGSLLSFSRKQGIVLSSHCQTGSCQTCMVRVKGEQNFEYSQHKPTRKVPAGHCLSCIATPTGNLNIEPLSLSQGKASLWKNRLDLITSEVLLLLLFFPLLWLAASEISLPLPLKYASGYILLLTLILLSFQWKLKSLSWHSFLGVFSLLAFFAHVDGQPQGWIELILFLVFLWVSSSGLTTFVMQKWLSHFNVSIDIQSITVQQKKFREQAERLALESIAQTNSSKIADFYREELASFFYSRNLRQRPFQSPALLTRGFIDYADKLEVLKNSLDSAVGREIVGQMITICQEKQLCDQDYVLWHRRKRWLFWHSFLAVSLLVLALLHTALVHLFF